MAFPALVFDSLTEPFFSRLVSFDEFMQLFPKDYRDHPEVKIYFRALRKKHNVSEDQVRQSIEAYCDENKQRQRAHDNCQDDLPTSLEKAVSLLEHVEEELSSELTTLHKQNKQMRDTLNRTTPQMLVNFNRELNPAVEAYQTVERKILPNL